MEKLIPWSEREFPFRPPEHPNTTQGLIYFIRCQGWVKIGFTTEACAKISSRIRHMQTGNPFPLELLLTTPGTYVDEKRLHYKLKKLRGLGEWFSDGAEVQAIVASIQNGASAEVAGA